MCQHREALNPSTGERVCARCGLVLGPLFSSAICRDPDRGYGESLYQREWDLAVLERRHDCNLGTELYPLRKGHPDVRPETRYWWNRVRRYKLHASSREYRLREIFCEIDRLCSYMGLPRSVQDELCHSFRKLAGHRGGRSHLRTLANLIYIVTKSRGIPRSLKGIDRVFEEFYGESYRTPRHHRLGRIHELAHQLGYSTVSTSKKGAKISLPRM